MKVAIISDTHLPRFRARLAPALRQLEAEKPGLILHCGDLTTLQGVQAFESIAPVDAVAGNNDGPEIVGKYGRRKIVVIEGARIGMLHGDGMTGTPLDRARKAFAPEDVDAVAFGHSHVPYMERFGTVWIVNPGSITDKRREHEYSFAIVEIAAGRFGTPRLVRFA